MVMADHKNWRYKIDLIALHASDNTGTTAEKYTTAGQSDFKSTELNYIFGIVTCEDEKFSDYQYRVSEVIGYGRRAIVEPDRNLDLEYSPGARQSKLDKGHS